jgi:hypothetical protein
MAPLMCEYAANSMPTWPSECHCCPPPTSSELNAHPSIHTHYSNPACSPSISSSSQPANQCACPVSDYYIITSWLTGQIGAVCVLRLLLLPAEYDKDNKVIWDTKTVMSDDSEAGDIFTLVCQNDGNGVLYYDAAGFYTVPIWNTAGTITPCC